MKIMPIILIIISFSSSLYAADSSNTYGGAISGGINQGLQNIYQIQQMRMVEEQRRMLEQQRLMMEQEERRRVEQHRLMMEQQNSDMGNDAKRARFFAYMAAMVPDWKTIDIDPAFIEWLSEPVPYTKVTKLQLLQAAARELDAETTAQFFLDYKAALQSSKSSADTIVSKPGRKCEENCVSSYNSKELKSGLSIEDCIRILCN